MYVHPMYVHTGSVVLHVVWKNPARNVPATMKRGAAFLIALLWAVFHVVGKADSVVGSTYLHHASKKCKEWSMSLGGCP